MLDTAHAKLTRAGYTTRYGADGLLHILVAAGYSGGMPQRGARALCGATASRRDYRNDKPLCSDCAQSVLIRRDGKWLIVAAE